MAKHQLFCTAAFNRAKEIDKGGKLAFNVHHLVTDTARKS